MMNGTISRILYIGAIIAFLICIAGIVYSSIQENEPSVALVGIVATLAGFLFGTHVTPPNVQKISGADLVASKADIPEGTRIVDRETVQLSRAERGGD